MKEFIEFVKKLWENKRTRSLSILILYFFFFLFVFSFLSANTPDKESIDSVEDENIQDVSKDEFYYLNDIEIINYSVLDSFGNVVQDYDMNLINSRVIYNLVKNSILASTNYIENSNTYYISVKDYEKIINNTVVDIDGNVKIIVSDVLIVLDFTEYYGYKINIGIRS